MAKSNVNLNRFNEHNVRRHIDTGRDRRGADSELTFIVIKIGQSAYHSLIPPTNHLIMGFNSIKVLNFIKVYYFNMVGKVGISVTLYIYNMLA